MTFIPAIANARQQYLPKDNRNKYLIAFFILLMWHLGRTNLGKSWKQKIYHHLLQLSKDFPDPNSLNNRRKFQISTRVPSKNITKYQMKSFDWDPFCLYPPHTRIHIFQWRQFGTTRLMVFTPHHRHNAPNTSPIRPGFCSQRIQIPCDGFFSSK